MDEGRQLHSSAHAEHWPLPDAPGRRCFAACSLGINTLTVSRISRHARASGLAPCADGAAEPISSTSTDARVLSCEIDESRMLVGMDIYRTPDESLYVHPAQWLCATRSHAPTFSREAIQ